MHKNIATGWKKEDQLHFIKLLQQFYIDANCKEFFSENSSFYTEIEDSFKPIYKDIDLKWFYEFFGVKSNYNFKIILVPVNGGANYAVDISIPNQKKCVYSLIGNSDWSSDNHTIYNKTSIFPTVIHEFVHSFTDQIATTHKSIINDCGAVKIEENRHSIFERNGYGTTENIIQEYLVRASVIQYMKDHNFDNKDIKNNISEDTQKGFIHISELVDKLNEYKNHREQYPILDSYFVEIMSVFGV